MNTIQSIRIIAFLIVAHEFGTCYGQQKPLHTFPNFSNETVGHDFCAVHRLTLSGKTERRDALRGMNLSVAMFSYQLNAKTGAIDEEVPDVAVLFLDELSRRAGFQWRNSYGIIETPKPNLNETYSDILVWAGGAYDVVGEYFYRSQERVERGILFPEGWVDADVILVKTTGEKKEDSLSFFNFLAPFSYGLWGLLLLTVIITGFTYYLIDYLDSKIEHRNRDLGFKASMFNAAWLFTGHTLHEPKSAATRLLVFASSFLCLLTVAAYTANLVSFLLPQNTDKIVVKDMKDVIKYDLSCCIDEADFNNQYMRINYPTVRLVEIDDPVYGDQVYRALARSECDLLITDEYMFRKRKESSEYNQNCSLTAVGTIYNTDGYFPVMDSSDRCTSLVSEVLTLHLLEMKRDKTYDTLWKNVFSKSATVICDEDAKEDDEDIREITVANMYGVFVLFFAALLGAMLWSFIHLCSRHDARPVVNEFIRDIKVSIAGNTSHTPPRPSAVSNLESIQEEINAEDPLGMRANFGGNNRPSNEPRTKQEDLSSQLHNFLVKQQARDDEKMRYVQSINYNIQRFEENVNERFRELERRVNRIEKKLQ